VHKLAWKSSTQISTSIQMQPKHYRSYQVKKFRKLYHTLPESKLVTGLLYMHSLISLYRIFNYSNQISSSRNILCLSLHLTTIVTLLFSNSYTVKSKVYFYPKNWVVLPVIQMTQSFGYNASLLCWY